MSATAITDLVYPSASSNNASSAPSCVYTFIFLLWSVTTILSVPLASRSPAAVFMLFGDLNGSNVVIGKPPSVKIATFLPLVPPEPAIICVAAGFTLYVPSIVVSFPVFTVKVLVYGFIYPLTCLKVMV